MKTLYLCSIGIYCCLLSCRNDANKQKAVSDRKMTFRNDTIDTSKPSHLYCLIRMLEHDKYDISIDTSFKKTIYFIEHKDISDQGDTFKIQAERLITVKARRNYEIPNTAFYPELKIQQISLDKAENIDNTLAQINHIITNVDDIYNEKVYDRIRKSNSDLIYIETNAKVFEEFVIHYDQYLEKTINDR